MKILLVEDDSRISGAIAEALTRQHYVVEIASDGSSGLAFAETGFFDLVILDLTLPKLDGLIICQKLRQAGSQTPILMLTARDASGDSVRGLDLGADDYVIKPFDLSELMARVRALLRRGKVVLSPILAWENLTLNPSECHATYDQQALTLTPKEYGLLELFLRYGSCVLSRQTILDNLWQFEASPGEETVKVHLQSLRRKLKIAGAPPHLIETVYGMGYRLNPNL
jgi:two-component system, OmpR family, response regulator